MTETIIVALLSLAGTLLGSLFGILTANKLTNYRIEQLEQKVAAHNNVITRVYQLETQEQALETKMKTQDGITDQVRDQVRDLDKRETVLEKEISVANHRISDLEKFHN